MSKVTIELSGVKHIKYMSDLHIDSMLNFKIKKFNSDMLYSPLPNEKDKETLLLLGGDIWTSDKMFSFYNHSWIKQLSQQYLYIVFVLGNHDYWGGNLITEPERVKKHLNEQGITNVYLLHNNTITFNNVKLLGATLWTDFNNDKHVKYKAPDIMNDYKYIKAGAGFHKIWVKDIENEFYKSKIFIFENAKKDFPEQKIFVMTHHAPHVNSLNSNYHEEALNEIEQYYYYSNLEQEILSSDIDLWLHGHTHNTVDYYIGKTQVLTNPLGWNKENIYFKEDFYILNNI